MSAASEKGSGVNEDTMFSARLDMLSSQIFKFKSDVIDSTEHALVTAGYSRHAGELRIAPS